MTESSTTARRSGSSLGSHTKNTELEIYDGYEHVMMRVRVGFFCTSSLPQLNDAPVGIDEKDDQSGSACWRISATGS